MATTTRTVTGSLPEVVAFIEQSVMAQSASMEAAVDLETREGGVCVRGYERYSWTGSNRVGMTVTSVQDGPYVHIAGISLGGSQAMFFKVNTLGEENFLGTLTSRKDTLLGTSSNCYSAVYTQPYLSNTDLNY